MTQHKLFGPMLSPPPDRLLHHQVTTLSCSKLNVKNPHDIYM